MILTKDHLSKLMITVYIYKGETLEGLSQTNISYHLRACNDSDPRSYGQIQGQWKENAKFMSGLF